MVRAVRKTVTIQPGGRVEVTSSDLPAGRQAEVIVLVASETPAKSYADLFGSGRGGFASAEAADQFLRRERDAWDN